MPSNVRLFEILYFLAVAVSIVTLVLEAEWLMAEWNRDEVDLYLGWTIVAVLIAVACLLAWLTSRRRKNWARWALLGLSLATLFIVVLDLQDTFTRSVLTGSLTVLNELLVAAALYLIFTGNARAWFAKPHSS